MAQENTTDLIDINALAKKLNVPVSRLYSETRRRGENTIPVVRIGKYCRFDAVEVINFFRKQTRANNYD